MIIYKSKENNIFRNLAKEEYLLGSKDLDSPALMLWQSEAAVVIGKHQNPWRECLVDELKAEGIPLARRISGGGTVFHDLGNLNYAIITDDSSYDSQKIYEMIFNALQQFGLKGKLENKSNLVVDGKKFSGNAFTFRKKRVLHHGTLLINADLDKLRSFLNPQHKDIETKAIASIPASVVNLHDLNPTITVESLSEAVINSFKATFNGKQEILDESFFPEEKIEEISQRLRSKEWLFGKTPKFTIDIDGQTHEVTDGSLPNM